jgi:hypothetical protein
LIGFWLEPIVSPLVSFLAFEPALSIMTAVFLYLVVCLLILSVALADRRHVRRLKPKLGLLETSSCLVELVFLHQ